MSEQFFIRLRGRIQGPFSSDQLQALAKRGQFSRTYEVSTDGLNWSRATSWPELFPAQTDFVPIELTTPAEEAALPPEPPPATAAPKSDDLWHYCQLGTNYGPVDFTHLQYLAKTGQIQPDDLVWKEAFKGWIAAGSVPGLFTANAGAAAISDDAPATGATGPSQVRTCPFCAEQIAASAIKCKHCGSILVPLPHANNNEFGSARSGLVYASNPPKDPLLMAILSGCCIAGLGQIILGQTTKGVMILLGSMICGAATAGVSILVTWPLGGLDAYLIAKKLKEGRSVGQWECF